MEQIQSQKRQREMSHVLRDIALKSAKIAETGVKNCEEEILKVSVDPKNYFVITPGVPFTINNFCDVVFKGKKVAIDSKVEERLKGAREFISHIIASDIKVYSITSGFANMKKNRVSPELSSLLSHNLIQSHDTCIGEEYFPVEVVRGTLFVRIHHLAQGYSGWSRLNLQKLVRIFNEGIIPYVPVNGAIGTSDIIYLSRICRVLMGEPEKVFYKGKIRYADEVFKECKISPLVFQPKEGLGFLSGNQITVSLMIMSFLRLVHNFENQLALVSMFFNTIDTVKEQFSRSLMEMKNLKGQNRIASLLRWYLQGSPFLEGFETEQNDYAIRAFPQLFGFHFESLKKFYKFLKKEMNCVVDNPLIFRGEEIKDVNPKKIFHFKNQKWAFVNSGNWMQEYSAQYCDELRRTGSNLIVTLEKQISYLLNPSRHKLKYLPEYLIFDPKTIGLNSGFLAIPYTAINLLQKICYYSKPVSVFNVPLGNGSEEIHPFSSTSAHFLLKQSGLVADFNVLLAVTFAQAYGVMRETRVGKGKSISDERVEEAELVSEKIFKEIQKSFQFPIKKDRSYTPIFRQIRKLLKKMNLRKVVKFPMGFRGEEDWVSY